MVRGARQVLLLAAFWCGLAAGAELSAAVDRTELAANEHVLLTLTLRDSDTRLRAEGVDPNVDLGALTADFDLGPPQASHRFKIVRGRGRATSELTVALFPKRAGRLVVPPFHVAGLSSAAIALEIHTLEAARSPEVFARGGVETRLLWQGEQTLVYLDLYHRVALKSASLGAEIEIDPPRVELARLPPQERTEDVAGVRYDVTRSAWALTPLAGGDFTVNLPDVWLETADERRLRLPPGEARVTARPRPAGVPATALVGRPQLALTTPPATDAEVGQALPWEITLRARAGSGRLPESLPGLEFVSGIKAYIDAPERRIEANGDAAWGVAIYRGVVIPLQAGEFTLPEVRVPYFDPDTAAMAAAVLPGRTLTVAPAAGVAQSGAPQDPSGEAAAPAGAGGWRRYLAPAFAALWLLTLALWWRAARGRRERGAGPALPSAGNGGDPLKSRLLAAFGAATLEQGLADWERRCGVDEELRRTVRAVQRRCYGPAQGPAHDVHLGAAVARAAAQIRKHRPPAPAPDS